MALLVIKVDTNDRLVNVFIFTQSDLRDSWEEDLR